MLIRTQELTNSYSPVRANKRCPISVIILTYNEETNIGECLRRLEWADEVILVDSGSDDGTLNVARDIRSDIRIFTNPFEDFGQQRNWALDSTHPSHPWILFLDADEHCNHRCAEAIQRMVADPQDNVGFYLTYRNYFLGHWIRYCTLYPSWQLRLLKAGKVRYRKEGHGQKEIADGPLGHIHQPYDHFGFSKGISDWIDRHNRYSTAELELILRLRQEPVHLSHMMASDPLKRRLCLKRLAARIGFRPWLRFIYTYFVRWGFLDGRAGFLFCLLRVAHEIHITVKLAESEANLQHAEKKAVR